MTVYLVGADPAIPGCSPCAAPSCSGGPTSSSTTAWRRPRCSPSRPPDAELITAGKAPGQVDLTQEQINEVLVDRGRTAGCVVRLKGGDPFVFGRGGEEAEALAAAGVPFEVVPGITSAIGAAAYAGIPVTHRGVSTHFTVVTGHEDPAKDRTDVDWEALARAGGTLVILMGAGRIGEIARRLIDGGRAARHAGRRGPQRHPARPAHRARHARHHRRRRGASHPARSSSATSPRSTSRGSKPARCSAGRSW